MKKQILFLFAAALLLASCTNSSKTVSILTNEGYTDIQTTGYAPFSCGDDDTYSTGFKAKTKKDKT